MYLLPFIIVNIIMAAVSVGIILKSPRQKPEALKYPGNDLLSQGVSTQVPSVLEGLTAVFGMGTGVSPPLSSPENLILRF